MIQKHELDWMESQRVLNACGTHLIEAKDCYQNTFNVLTKFEKKIREQHWRVGFGYMESSVPSIMVRHAFWIANGKVIDPTIALVDGMKSQAKHRQYMTYRRFSVDEYIQALLNEDGSPSLFLTSRETEREAHKWATANGIILCG